MASSEETQALSQEVARLRDQLNPLLSEQRARRVPGLATLSSETLDAIRNLGDFSFATRQALDTFAQSAPAARHEQLANERKLLLKVQQTGATQTDHTVGNVARSIIPIRFQGLIVACLDTGPIKVGPLDKDQARDLKRRTGAGRAAIQHLANTLPVHTSADVTRVRKLYEQLARFHEQNLAPQRGTSTFANSQAASLSDALARHAHTVFTVILGRATLLDDSPLHADDKLHLDYIKCYAASSKELTQNLFAAADHAATPEDAEADARTDTDAHIVATGLFPLIAAHRNRDIELGLDLQAPRPVVAAARRDIYQLLFTLLSAAHETAISGSKILLSTQNLPNDLSIRVHDAAGIPFDTEASTLTQGLSAFGPLENVELETRLAELVHRAQDLGGRVDIHPQPGCMTAIEVVIPLAVPDGIPAMPGIPAVSAAAPHAMETIQDTHPNAGFHSRIWLVQSNPVSARTQTALLQRGGHEVQGFHSLYEFISTWQSSNVPDLVIADYLLGDDDASDLRNWLNEQAGATQLPVIITSSLPSTHPGITRALDLPKTYFLPKPFNEQDLLDATSVALGLTLV